MTIQEAIDRVDRDKANVFTTDDKVAWLSELDGLIWTEIMLTHEGVAPWAVFRGYNQDTPTDTHLLVPDQYADIYKYYMEAQIDAVNQDSEEAARSMEMYNVAYTTFEDYWNRTHMPRQACCEFRL